MFVCEKMFILQKSNYMENQTVPTLM